MTGERIHIEPGPDAARGIGLGPQTYGWVVKDEHGNWLGYSCTWYATPDEAREAAELLFRPEVLLP